MIRKAWTEKSISERRAGVRGGGEVPSLVKALLVGAIALSYSIHVIIHFRSDRYILDRNQINVCVMLSRNNVYCVNISSK